jgi:hypothetical protein
MAVHYHSTQIDVQNTTSYLFGVGVLYKMQMFCLLVSVIVFTWSFKLEQASSGKKKNSTTDKLRLSELTEVTNYRNKIQLLDHVAVKQ